MKSGKTLSTTGDTVSKKCLADGTEYTPNSTPLRDLWASCDSTVFLVLDDEDGENMANAQARHVHGGIWLYVDDVDGFSFIEEEAVSRLAARTQNPGGAVKTLDELRSERMHRIEIGLILGRLLPEAENAVIAAHRSGKREYHRPILEALRLLRQAHREVRAGERSA